MQRAPTLPALLQALRALDAAPSLLEGFLAQRGVRQFGHRAPPPPGRHQADRSGRPSLGQLCREFQEYARRNNARQAEALHEAYLAQGGEPKLWMVNTLIGVYARRRQPDKAFALYHQLLGVQEGTGRLEPNLFTYTNLLNALAKAEHPPYNLGPEVAQRAEAVFAEMLGRGIQPNQIAYHTLMDVQAKAALPDAAFATYRAMRTAGLAPDTTSFSILMAACGRAGDHARAAEVMERLMPQAGVPPTTAIWNSMLGAFAKCGSVDGAYATWVRMLESGAIPDAYTERALVDALSSHPALAADVVAEARQIRRNLEQQAQQQQLGGGGGQGERGDSAAPAPEEASAGAGSGDSSTAGAERDGSEAGGQPAPRPAAPLRQGELVVDTFHSGTHSPMAGTAYPSQLYRGAPGSMGAQPGGWQHLQLEQSGGTVSPQQQLQQQPSAGAQLDLKQLLWLDLHGMSQAAARALLLRRLEMLVNLAHGLVFLVEQELEDEAAAAQEQQQQQLGESGSAAAGSAGGSRAGTSSPGQHRVAQQGRRRPQQQQQQQQQQSQPQSRLRPPAGLGAAYSRRGPAQRHALVIVTGAGRHSKEAGAGVLKAAVGELLTQHGIPFLEDPANAGRLLVPWPGLRSFVQAQQEAMQTDHFFGLARARYTYIAAGVAGLMAAALIVPRLAPWMPTS